MRGLPRYALCALPVAAAAGVAAWLGLGASAVASFLVAVAAQVLGSVLAAVVLERRGGPPPAVPAATPQSALVWGDDIGEAVITDNDGYYDAAFYGDGAERVEVRRNRKRRH